MRSVLLDGRRYTLKHIHEEYKRQRDEARKAKQLTLFELREDCRPASQRSAGNRYEEPLLFEK